MYVFDCLAYSNNKVSIRVETPDRMFDIRFDNTTKQITKVEILEIFVHPKDGQCVKSCLEHFTITNYSTEVSAVD